MTNLKIFSLMAVIILVLLLGCRKNDDAKNNELTQEKIEHLPDSLEELKRKLVHSPSVQIGEVLQKVEVTLQSVYAEKTPERFPNWIAFHSILMYGDSAYADYHSEKNADENLKRIFAILQNSNTKESGAFVVREGLPYPRHTGEYFTQEHHPNQFLHYFSMSGAPLEAKLKIDEKEYTFHDLLERALLETKTTDELAYTVLVYSHYLEPDKQWKNKFGETMRLATLLEKLLKTPEKTCLGTHRLSALARVYAKRELKEDKATNKLWTELERQVLESIVRLKQLQREDGGFEPPGLTAGTPSQDNIDVYYTGHSLEWITFLDKEYCRDDWVVQAIEKLSDIVQLTYSPTFRNMDALGNEESHFDFDALSHAMSALRRWRDTVRAN
ncbi:MAG: hypothetical protein LBJ67_04790, partial [Planctomycetaceae bacterium]|nr:hypothetical protein [Planctomycetaceae bacterium]